MSDREIVVGEDTLQVGDEIQYLEGVDDTGRDEERYCFTGTIVCVDCPDKSVFCVKRLDGEEGGGCNKLWKVGYILYREYGHLIGDNKGKIAKLKLSLHKKGYKI